MGLPISRQKSKLAGGGERNNNRSQPTSRQKSKLAVGYAVFDRFQVMDKDHQIMGHVLVGDQKIFSANKSTGLPQDRPIYIKEAQQPVLSNKPVQHDIKINFITLVQTNTPPSLSLSLSLSLYIYIYKVFKIQFSHVISLSEKLNTIWTFSW